MKRTSSILAASLLAFWAGSAFSQDGKGPRVVLQGYDPVAYFIEQKPVKGSLEYEKEFDGARYRFSSARNLSMFSADPERYEPQFAGWCAMSMGMGKRVEGDPTAWKIIDGKLYVFGSARGLAAAEKDPTIVARSREAWKASK